jgi:glycosyltransferase involved in cell wall biosynthesis
MKKVSIILPAHNEGKSILNTLTEIQNAVENNTKYNFDIYVSEDGSSDNTREEVLRAAKNSKIEVLLSPETSRLGYSKAIQRAIKLVNSDILIFMDSDGQYEPKEIDLLLQKLSDRHLVVGFRNPRVDSLLRIVYSNAFRIVFYLLFRLKLKDPSSPFIVAHKKDLENLAKIEFYLAYGFWWEFQARINRMNLAVIEVPVTHRNRAQGETQVYTFKRLPKIVQTHLIGLFKLKKEIG